MLWGKVTTCKLNCRSYNEGCDDYRMPAMPRLFHAYHRFELIAVITTL